MTGHAETVEVVYDTRQLSTRRLLSEFFLLHDFTKHRRSEGGQYRSAIFFDPSVNQVERQERTARQLFILLSQNGFPPATELRRCDLFYPAANRHQQFCSARGMQPQKQDSAKIKEILTL
jgi:peptide methionine sulfoxide reductase MsrA